MNSFWLEIANKIENLGTLEEDTSADICIIGAGICGLTTAYYLIKKGYNVVIIEKDEVTHGTTGHTTAKITSQHGLIYHYLSKQYGIQFAKKYYDANEEAIRNIEEIIKENNISCDFERKDNYVYTTKDENIAKIKEEAQALKYINLESKETNEVNLPFKVLDAIKFKNQAQFNPIKYIEGLVKYILTHNGRIFTKTVCTDINKDNDKYIVNANNNKIYAKYVVLASQYPFLKVPGFYFAKMYQASSYVIGIETKNTLPDGMFISIDEPSLSYRTALENGKNILLIGGAGHKTGTKIDYEQTYGELEKNVKKYYPDCNIKYRWSTRDAITLDKIAYIGKFSKLLPNIFIATGFNKWGMTTSNVAANIITDNIISNGSIYDEIFNSTRLKPFVNKDEIKNMLVDSTKSMIGKRLHEEELEIDEIKNNSAGIVEIDGKKVGVYKDENGKKYYINPVCTHMGCILEWNDADKTWDCPCHGSRFDRYGFNIAGPAIENLKNDYE